MAQHSDTFLVEKRKDIDLAGNQETGLGSKHIWGNHRKRSRAAASL